MATISVPKFLCLIIFLSNFMPQMARKTPPVAFIFGDSTADVGTNNHLLSKARANFPHNGVDYPHQCATGRFSNGFNSADELAKRFGLARSPPPYLYLLTLGSNFTKSLSGGVNFASGGAGILDITGANLTVVPLSEQIDQFASVRDNFTAAKGPDATKEWLCKSLFFISVGGNDIFGYFASNDSTSKPDPDEFMSVLISEYSKHITNLYNLGARKFGIIGVPTVGCCPYQRLVQKVTNGTNGCLDPMNTFAQVFHSALNNLLQNISMQLPEMKYALGNTYQMTYDVINNSSYFGFENVDTACCGYGGSEYLNAAGPCNRTASLCPDRKKYLFWDLFHPTQKASKIAAGFLYNGPSYYVSPITFSQLAYGN